MKTLVNEQVYHNKYGYGIIVEEDALRIKIKFDTMDDVKSFTYPNVFEKFIKFTDVDLQNEIFNLAVNQRELDEKEVEDRRTQKKQQEVDERKIRLAEKKKKTSKKKIVK